MTKSGFTKDKTQAVKGVAIMVMLFHHLFLSTDRYKGMELITSPFTSDQLTRIAAAFKICVGIFFFLSAYGMTISFKRKNENFQMSAGEYERTTFKRIFSIFYNFLFVYIVAVIGTAIISPARFELYKTGFKGLVYILFDVLGLANVMGTPTLIGTWWYLSLAYFLILIFPILLLAYRKFGGAVVLLGWLIVMRVIGFEMTEYSRWVFTAIVGVIFADRDVFTKLGNIKLCKNKVISKSLKFVLLTVLVIAFIFLRKEATSAIIDIFDCAFIVTLCWYVYEFVSCVKGLNFALMFLGKHSMNIFLLHTFFRTRWCHDFIYSFKYWWLDFLVLLGISLISSIIMDLIKKYSGFDRLGEFIMGKISGSKPNKNIA